MNAGDPLRMKSRARSERTGPTPAMILHRPGRPSARTPVIQRANTSTSNTYWVCTNSAPAATFLASRRARNSRGGANGFSTAPMSQLGGVATGRPDISRPSSRMVRAAQSQLHAVQVEHRLGVGMIPETGVIAGQQQHVGHAEGPGREQIRL